MTLLRRVILIVLVALLPALGAEVYNQRALRAAQQAELDGDALRQARATAAELGRILDGTRNALVALAAMPAIQSQDATACAALLQAIRGRFAAISVLSLIDADDRVVCSSLPQVVSERNPGGLAHVVLARQRGGFAAAGYLPGSSPTHAGQLATAMPVRVGPDQPASGGQPAGGDQPASGDQPVSGGGAVLVADIGLGWLGKQMRALAEQEGTRIVVVDRQGVVLAAEPDGPAPGTPLPAAERSLLAGSGPALARVTGPDGRTHAVAIARLPDLAVLARIEHSPSAAAERQAALRSYLMFAAGLAAALAFATLLARQTIAAPVARILRTIGRWRAGDAGARVETTDAASELGRIGGALNELLASFERSAGEMRAQQTVLEQRVAERTRQLRAEVREREQAETMLQQAQRMEAMGKLTGGVAHDFNNLLTAIIGNLELAERRSRDRPAVTRLLAGAMRAAERGAALTQRMLAFGRQQYLHLQPTDVAALLAGMDDLLARSVGPTVAMSVAAEPELWPARADPSQLELVLLNLAINARDAMPRGGALGIIAANETVAHGASHPARLSAGDYVRISVRDSGAGMDAATLARVLEPFFTTKPVGKGSGLGLSMAQGVAAQSGGGLAVDSRPGEGTAVSVWLPRALTPAPAEPAGPGRAAPDPALPAHRRGEGLAVLLVDDDADVVEATRQCLEDAGFSVLRRADGAAALALMDGGAPVDLLIADLAMPGMNGVQLAAQARARRPGLPVLLATGYADAASIQDGNEPGYPVLEKPFKAAQLLDAVSGLLTNSAVSAGR